MYAHHYNVRQRRWLIVLALCLVLSIVLSGRLSQAATTAQTPVPSLTKPILLTVPVPDPKQEGVVWFAPTGHTLRGKFLQYWQQYGSLAQFGYPLTEEFFEPSGVNNSPLQVQYFERNRFELHPENQPPYDVLLGTLSREFRAQDPPAPQQPAPTLYFLETGHNLAGKFLEYWQSHGGLAVHGYPITEAVMEQSTNGKQYLVQWFERSRMELHPENAGSEYEVLLGVEGRQLSEKKGYPYGWFPQFGHAADFSWISGLEIPTRMCPQPECGCPLFNYLRQGIKNAVELMGSEVIANMESGKLDGQSYVVIFGRWAGANDPKPTCPPGYVVTRVQSNPEQ
jgi:hypothetical protein